MFALRSVRGGGAGRIFQPGAVLFQFGSGRFRRGGRVSDLLEHIGAVQGYVEVGGEKYYAVVAGSIRNDAYPDHESVSAFRFTGTALEIREDGITVMFTDQNKDVKGVYEV